MTALSTWWKKLSDDKRRQYGVAGAVLGFMLIILLVQLMSSGPANKPKRRAADPETFSLGASKEVGLADIQAQLSTLIAEQDRLRKQLGDGTLKAEASDKSVQTTIDEMTRKSNAERAELRETIAKLEARMNDRQAAGPTAVTIAPPQVGGVKPAPGAPGLSAPLPVTVVGGNLPAAPDATKEDKPISVPRLRMVGAESHEPAPRSAGGPATAGAPSAPGAGANATAGIGAPGAPGARVPVPADANNAGTPLSVLMAGAKEGIDRMGGKPHASVAYTEHYVPAGSIIEGVAITGIDAPTASAAQKSPMPMLVRLKHEAILPNMQSYDISECFVLLSGFGQLSSERAMLRTETLSCVNNDRTVLEARLDGHAVDTDGKVGLRGRLVSKQGAVIARAMLAGVLSGIGKGLQPTTILPFATTDNASIANTPNLRDVAEAGVSSGVGSGLNKIAQFYLDQAKEMFPVIEVDAGRKVTIMLVRGTTVKKN